MSQVILPTVGRHVHYHPDIADRHTMVVLDGQPLFAVIVHVQNERSVNLAILDHQGFSHTRLATKLVQPDDAFIEGEPHATWMPYQVKSAADVAEPVKTDGEPSPVVADILAATATHLDVAPEVPAETDGNVVDPEYRPADGAETEEPKEGGAA